MYVVYKLGTEMNHVEKPASVSGRRERKRLQTGDHLAATAFRLFEAEGYASVTMEQIATAADVAKGTLYSYFPVKEALLAYRFRQEIADGMAALHDELQRKRSFAARMRGLLEASAEWNTSRRDYLPHYLRFRMAEIDPSVRGAVGDGDSSGVAPILEKLFRDAQQAGEIRTDVDVVELASTFEFMCLGAVTVWLHQPTGGLQKHFEFVLGVFLDGVATLPVAPRKKR